MRTFFAWAQKSRGWGSAHAHLTQAEQQGELRRFVEFGRESAGSDPQGLSFASQGVDSPARGRVNPRPIPFVTLRRRGAALLRRLEPPPASTGKRAVIALLHRGHPPIPSVEEAVKRRGSEGPLRQLAVSGLGRDRPRLFLSPDFEETPAATGSKTAWA